MRDIERKRDSRVDGDERDRREKLMNNLKRERTLFKNGKCNDGEQKTKGGENRREAKLGEKLINNLKRERTLFKVECNDDEKRGRAVRMR